MTDTLALPHQFSLIGGRPCLDFTNTINYDDDHTNERLRDYADLVSWSVLVGALADADGQRLLEAAARQPAQAAAVLAQARTLRAVLHAVFSAAARGAEPEPGDLASLNQVLARVLPCSRLVLAGEAYGWEWNGEAAVLERVLWPVAWSAVELLTSPDLHRVGECASEGCGWLFLDMSRNRSRRWCDMKDCGNRAKARRHYYRGKSET